MANSKITKKLWFKTATLCLVCAFTLTGLPGIEEAYALSPWAGSQRVEVRREMLGQALDLGRIEYADPNDPLLDGSNALLLSHGKILLSPELKNDPLLKLRAVFHEEIEAVMQILERQDRGRYSALMNLILSDKAVVDSYLAAFPLEETPLSDELLFNDMMARAFELILLIEDKAISNNEMTPRELEFATLITPLINAYKHSYFTGIFWDQSVREMNIRLAIANGHKFHQTATRKKNAGGVKVHSQPAAKKEDTGMGPGPFIRAGGEARDDWKGLGACKDHSIALMRLLAKRGINASIFTGRYHYWVETEDHIIDAFPEGNDIECAKEAGLMGNGGVLYIERDSEIARKFYNGKKTEDLTKMAIASADDEEGYRARRVLQLERLVSIKLRNLSLGRRHSSGADFIEDAQESLEETRKRLHAETKKLENARKDAHGGNVPAKSFGDIEIFQIQKDKLKSVPLFSRSTVAAHKQDALSYETHLKSSFAGIKAADNDTMNRALKDEHPLVYLMKQMARPSGKAVWVDVGPGYGIALRQGKALLGEKLVTYGVDPVDWDGYLKRDAELQNEVKARFGPDIFMSINDFQRIDQRMESVILPEAADLITAYRSIQYSQNPLGTIRNLYNQLRPGGFLIVAGPIFTSPMEGHDMMKAIVKDLNSAGIYARLASNPDSAMVIQRSDGRELDLNAKVVGINPISPGIMTVINYAPRDPKKPLVLLTGKAGGKARVVSLIKKSLPTIFMLGLAAALSAFLAADSMPGMYAAFALGIGAVIPADGDSDERSEKKRRRNSEITMAAFDKTGYRAEAVYSKKTGQKKDIYGRTVEKNYEHVFNALDIAKGLGSERGFRENEIEKLGLLAYELVSNIIDFGEGGMFAAGAVTVRNNIESIELIGWDSGPGIKDPEKERQRSERRVMSGTGFGLYHFMNSADEVIIESAGKTWRSDGWGSLEERGPSEITAGTKVTLRVHKRDRFGEFAKKEAGDPVDYRLHLEREKLFREKYYPAVKKALTSRQIKKLEAYTDFVKNYRLSNPYVAGPSSRTFGTFVDSSEYILAPTVPEWQVDKDARIVDLGGGLGSFGFFLASVFGFRHLTLVEWDKSKVEYSRKLLEALENGGLISPGSVTIKEGDFLEEDFSSYDVAYYFMGGAPETVERKIPEKLLEMKPGSSFILLGHEKFPLFKKSAAGFSHIKTRNELVHIFWREEQLSLMPDIKKDLSDLISSIKSVDKKSVIGFVKTLMLALSLSGALVSGLYFTTKQIIERNNEKNKDRIEAMEGLNFGAPHVFVSEEEMFKWLGALPRKVELAMTYFIGDDGKHTVYVVNIGDEYSVSMPIKHERSIHTHPAGATILEQIPSIADIVGALDEHINIIVLAEGRVVKLTRPLNAPLSPFARILADANDKVTVFMKKNRLSGSRARNILLEEILNRIIFDKISEWDIFDYGDGARNASLYNPNAWGYILRLFGFEVTEFEYGKYTNAWKADTETIRKVEDLSKKGEDFYRDFEERADRILEEKLDMSTDPAYNRGGSASLKALGGLALLSTLTVLIPFVLPLINITPIGLDWLLFGSFISSVIGVASINGNKKDTGITLGTLRRIGPQQKVFMEFFGFDMKSGITDLGDGFGIATAAIKTDTIKTLSKLLGLPGENNNIAVLVDMRSETPLAMLYPEILKKGSSPVMIFLHRQDLIYTRDRSKVFRGIWHILRRPDTDTAPWKNPYIRLREFFGAPPAISSTIEYSENGLAVFPSVYSEDGLHGYFNGLRNAAQGMGRVLVIGSGTGSDITALKDVPGVEEIVATESAPLAKANSEFNVSRLFSKKERHPSVSFYLQEDLSGLGKFDLITFACPLAITESVKKEVNPHKVRKVLEEPQVHGITFDPGGKTTFSVIKEAGYHLTPGGRFLMLNHDAPEIDRSLKAAGFTFEKQEIAISSIGARIILYLATLQTGGDVSLDSKSFSKKDLKEKVPSIRSSTFSKSVSYSITSYNTFKSIDRKARFQEDIQNDPVLALLKSSNDDFVRGLFKTYHGSLSNSFDSIIDRFERYPMNLIEGGINAELSITDNDVIITVEDNGSPIELDPRGIPLQKHKDFTKQLGGKGMGVSLTTEFVKKHGGSISFLPLKNGTKVEIRVPYESLPASFVSAAAKAGPISADKLKKDFDNACRMLSGALVKEYSPISEERVKAVSREERSGQSLILYADDLLENTAVIDLEKTVRKIASDNGIINGGKVIIFARDEKNGAILDKMIRTAEPGMKTALITLEDLSSRRNVDGSEVKEVEALVKEAKRSGAGDILAVIKGPSSDMKKDTPEALVDASVKLKIPVIILGLENAIYSFEDAIGQALLIKGQNGEHGWVVSLLPIRTISEDIRLHHEEYLATLKAYVAA
jgi:anti-sigma regulatory factor (Ser/Thr protein kinase)/SAM-dependent methyltransferase